MQLLFFKCSLFERHSKYKLSAGVLLSSHIRNGKDEVKREISSLHNTLMGKNNFCNNIRLAKE